jgi:integrase
MPSQTTGVTERHSRKCEHKTGACTCTPSYTAWVFDSRSKKKRYRTFSGPRAKTEAKGWRSDAVTASRKGTLAAPSRLTVEQEADAWAKRAEAGEVRTRGGRPFKPSVLRQYRSDLERTIVPAIGHVKVAQLHRRDVQVLIVDAMLAKGLSGSRVLGTLNALRAVLRRPLAHDELVTDPTSRLDLPATAGSRDRAASPQEAAELLAALPDEDRALWAVAIYGGLRRGELRALRCSDLDPGLTEIHVRHGWDDVDGQIAPKSEKGTRRVPVAGTLRLVLLEHLARTGRRGDDLVFGRTASEPFTPSSVRTRALGAWAATVVGAFLRGEPIALEPIGLHECRHTYVSLMHAAGNSLETIGDLVGHSSTYMTDKYRHLLEATRTDAAAALDALLAGNRSA